MTNEERVKKFVWDHMMVSFIDGQIVGYADSKHEKIELLTKRTTRLMARLKPYLLPDTEIDIEELGKG